MADENRNPLASNVPDSRPELAFPRCTEEMGRSFGFSFSTSFRFLTGERRKIRMTTNQNTNAVADSTSKAKTIGGTDTTQPAAGVEEAELLLESTREQEIRNRAYEIYLQRGAESGDETHDWIQAERELTK
jgi:hypothetical protein